MRRHSKLFKLIVLNIVTVVTLMNASHFKVLAAETSQSAFDEGKQLIEQYYIEDVSDTTLNEAKDLDSLVKALNDPYSAYFTAEQYNNFTSSINNSFVGIGIQVDTAPDGIKITAVYDKAPALDAGLKAGDIITEVDGHALSGLSTEEAVSYVKGPEGTTVHLQIKRDGNLLSFDIVRKLIDLPTVQENLIDKHIGYIEISSFGENTAAEFKNALDELKSEAADSYIIDLRNNPGGYLSTAFDIAGYFIGDSNVLKVQEKNSDPVDFTATKQDEVINKPIIFLTNEYSASASEILSAAVKDYKKAIFIGEKTYGKGVGQSVFTLSDNSYLKLTTFRFMSPLGNVINKVGISPDIKVDDDLSSGVDSLNAAKVLCNNPGIGSDLSNPIDRLYTIAYSATTNAMNVKAQKSINDAHVDLEALKGTDASFAIGEFSKQLDKVQHPYLVNIVNSIEKAQQTLKEEDINAAKASIDPDLPSVWRGSYSSAIDIIQQKLMKGALDSYDNAAASKDSKDINDAIAKFSEIETSADTGVSNWAQTYKSEMESLLK